jgi:hypothetical protein
LKSIVVLHDLVLCRYNRYQHNIHNLKNVFTIQNSHPDIAAVQRLIVVDFQDKGNGRDLKAAETVLRCLQDKDNSTLREAVASGDIPVGRFLKMAGCTSIGAVDEALWLVLRISR